MLRELECYLVGGAVRDELLGRPVKDRDWVVVGATVADMLDLGFSQVGRDFPVFLHPDTKDEYALARTERKSGSGHHGFEVLASPHVTLEQDLLRRDLTINAMARSVDNTLIDPFEGVRDLEQQILRHVSPAFAEDPLRVFRVARFAAELSGFAVAPETLTLLQTMCSRDELKTLSAERVWQETTKALHAPVPEAFFQVLTQVGGLTAWMAELEGQNYDFGKGDAHARFAQLGLSPDRLNALAERLKIGKSYQQIAEDSWRFAVHLQDWQTLSSESLGDMFEALQGHHNSERIDKLAQVVGVPEHEALMQWVEVFRQVKLEDEVSPGPGYGQALRQARIQALQRRG